MRGKRTRTVRRKVPQYPPLKFTSRTPLFPDRRRYQQNSKSGRALELNVMDSTHKIDALSRTASLALGPSEVHERFTPGQPQNQAQHIRTDSLLQEQVEYLQAVRMRSQHVNLGELAEEPTEGEVLKLQELTEADYLMPQSFAGPVENEDRALDLTVMNLHGCRTAVDPLDTEAATANVLTGMGVTEHLMKILKDAAVEPQRKFISSLRQTKLDERACRIRLKRQKRKSPVPRPAAHLPQTNSFTALNPSRPQTQDPEIMRHKSKLYFAPSRVGLSRAKSVGAMANRQTLKEREKLIESKSVAALTIRMSFCTTLLIT